MTTKNTPTKPGAEVGTTAQNACSNCQQWQNWTPRGYYDCFHDCSERGFAPKRPTPAFDKRADAPEAPHMERYKLSFMGRQVGAIGKFSDYAVTIWAENKEQANLALYQTHEHISNLKIEQQPQPAPEEPRKTQSQILMEKNPYFGGYAKLQLEGEPQPAPEQGKQAQPRKSETRRGEAAHSPLPWRQFTRYVMRDGRFLATAHAVGDSGSSSLGFAKGQEPEQDMNEAEANARLIVAAVNHADKLAEALRDLRNRVVAEKPDCLNTVRCDEALAAYEEARLQ